MTKAWVERGLSLPCSEFFLSVLNTYGLQPHNICPNSYLLLSNFVTLCEGHLGIRPDIKLWQFFFRVKKETKDKAMLNCGSMTFMLRPGRMYPPHDSHESVRYWNAGWFYEKNASVPEIHDARYIGGGKPAHHTPRPVSGDTAEEVPEDEEEEEEPRKVAPRPAKRPRAKASGSEAGASGEASAKKPKYSDCHSDRPRAYHKVPEEISGYRSSDPCTTKRFPHCSPIVPSSGGSISPSCRKHSTGDNSVTSSEKAGAGAGDVVVPKNFGDPADLTSTPKAYATKFFKQLTEPEKWELEQDLLNAMLNNAWGKPDAVGNPGLQEGRRVPRQARLQTKEPLGYPEKRRNKFPRDDVLSLAGDDCKDLISASRKICHNLSLKRSRTCSLRKLIKRMDILPELVTDLQASSARGAAAMTLTMCLAHHPKMDLDRVSSGVPPTADVEKLLDAVSGYDTRIARKIRHEEFYDKVVLPADEPLEDELQKERDAEARPAESGSQYTWTSSKDAPEEEEPKTSAATSDEDEESDEDVSSPAEGAKGKDPEHCFSVQGGVKTFMSSG
ncbi:hypothetical protein QYE76_031265 [Lolium multiflorum]|uniref:Transposase (putative) gypsy type domain-containing protein n=1 Tax=Lolium multiflorum TaxID=4521 RepID=A0AAD8VH89_LOLMU|nr:hypothetical protein QYE76_031265 [Lolium multiflorum]